MSTHNTSPANLFGGTWQRIENRFLLGAGSSYSNGTTGGESTHKLTTSEMPSHTHNILTGSTEKDDTVDIYWGGDRLARSPSTEWNTTSRNCVEANGGNVAHNNMPPYLVVYMWKRIA